MQLGDNRVVAVVHVGGGGGVVVGLLAVYCCCLFMREARSTVRSGCSRREGTGSAHLRPSLSLSIYLSCAHALPTKAGVYSSIDVLKMQNTKHTHTHTHPSVSERRPCFSSCSVPTTASICFRWLHGHVKERMSSSFRQQK